MKNVPYTASPPIFLSNQFLLIYQDLIANVAKINLYGLGPKIVTWQ